MPRNSASGANKQRKRPQRQESGRGRFIAQPGHTDPNLRLDGQRLEQSFEHLERTKEPARVVGLQGWKENKQPESQKSAHDDIWDHFWGDNKAKSTSESLSAATQVEQKDTSRHTSSPVPTPPRTATPELHKYHPSIPKATAVVPGRSADIVLKKDQGTGRTINGVINEILTRGDHPWGIKVRLTDGQVGRVQRVY